MYGRHWAHLSFTALVLCWNQPASQAWASNPRHYYPPLNRNILNRYSFFLYLFSSVTMYRIHSASDIVSSWTKGFYRRASCDVSSGVFRLPRLLLDMFLCTAFSELLVWCRKPFTLTRKCLVIRCVEAVAVFLFCFITVDSILL